MNTWLEIWADTGQSPPYVLIVQNVGSEISVFDPQENRKEIFSAPDYETVFNWLREDEFEPIRGRVEIDEEL